MSQSRVIPFPRRAMHPQPSVPPDPYTACFAAVARAMQGKHGLAAALAAIARARKGGRV